MPHMPAFKTVALIGRRNAPDIGAAVRTLADFLEAEGCKVLVERQTAGSRTLSGLPVGDRAEIGERADLAVVLGGDGSMLAAARDLAAYRVPLVGVNQGRLGFLTDIAASVMIPTMREILAGKYSLEERTMLAAEVRRGDAEAFSTLALNDAVVNKGAVGRLIEFLVHIDGEFIYDLRADGLIVATPTGSTAYSLSSNGPILEPRVPAFALVPISPHTLSNRPISVSDRSVIEITLRHSIDARVHFDGQPQFDLHEGDRVTVRRAAESTILVHPPGYSYYAMLREKLHWGGGY
jgi:NAD+ kinase